MTLRKTYTLFASIALPFAIAALVFLMRGDLEATLHSLVHLKNRTQHSTSPSRVFGDIYKNGVWGKNDAGEGYSGTGSTVSTTFVYRAFLQDFMKKNNIRSVVDAGCGDWEFSRTIDWSGIDYKGYDIVSSIIEKDRKSYASPNVSFFAANIVEDDLPAADLLVCKNVLQHLPNRDVKKFLSRLSKYRHVLLTDSVDGRTLTSDNHNITVGDFRPLDLTARPFNLRAKKVLVYFDGFDTHQVVHLGPPG